MSSQDTKRLSSVQTQAKPRLRPRASASLILIDRSGTSPTVLVGKRSSGHVFMPDLYVFPGGRRDPRDHALPYSRDLDRRVLTQLLAKAGTRLTPNGARALALAAIRELREETGLIFGSAQSPKTGAPDLSCLRLIARAVTPPGAIRRFDNRFFATFVDEAAIDPSALADSSELQDLRWISIFDLSNLKMPEITLAVLNELKILLESDPSLPFGSAVHIYSRRDTGFVRTRL
ncbi:NUDIX hydrolase [Rhizobium oryzicola]|uniref:NUDIX hydrolase n=1 Tax=Rhizobium oryzicola TaxID=1232668 RepID=A0ABT8SVZ2_9HYPH|nr:NUDIX hydrolase [Rhizobium oryzicola]MDO1581857.1 NUDIX hydrolase [Rhizobium oryzicola]